LSFKDLFRKLNLKKYEKAAEVVKRAYKENKTIKQVVLEMGLLSEKQLPKITQQARQMSGEARGGGAVDHAMIVG